MARDYIRIGGARQHNLKNVSLTIPRDRLVVMTGLSGSGKSSLAFDTIYAEGQRKYVESLSAYARQFLDQMEKPDVDFIEGLSPALAIEQRGAGSNPRSIIATTTEVYDYLRLLYAHVGRPHCPESGEPVVPPDHHRHRRPPGRPSGRHPAHAPGACRARPERRVPRRPGAPGPGRVCAGPGRRRSGRAVRPGPHAPGSPAQAHH